MSYCIAQLDLYISLLPSFHFSGSTSTISREINDEITSKNTYKIYTGRGALNGGTSSDSISNIEVNSTHPLVSFISMIAPSPDWFIGVHDVDLCNTTTGEWVDSVVRNLFPYDAGTDSGEEFSSPDLISNPQQEIHLLTNNITGSFKGDEPIKRFGTFTFEKTSDSNDRTATIAPEATPTNDYTSLIILMGTPTNGYTSSIILIQTPANGYTSSIVTTGVPADGYTFSITPTATANVNTPSTTPNGIATANTNIDITLILMLCILTTVGYIL